MVADALIVVLAADGKAGTGDKALDGAIAAATKAGDFERKAGRTLYLHNVDGVKSQRVVLSAARDASAKAFRAAVSAGLAALKNRAVKHLAVLAGEGVRWWGSLSLTFRGWRRATLRKARTCRYS